MQTKTQFFDFINLIHMIRMVALINLIKKYILYLNFRYVPGDNPPSQVFNVPWITVDVRNIQNIFHILLAL